jgi:hypothetical protein
MRPTSEELAAVESAQEQPALSFQLLRTVNPRQAVPLLAQAGLSDRDIATAVGATERSVRRWRTGTDRSEATRYWRQIDDLRAIVALLYEEGTLDHEGIVHWLRARNRLLADQRPLETLCEDGFEQVRDAALAFLSP